MYTYHISGILIHITFLPLKFQRTPVFYYIYAFYALVDEDYFASELISFFKVHNHECIQVACECDWDIWIQALTEQMQHFIDHWGEAKGFVFTCTLSADEFCVTKIGFNGF